MFLHNAYMLLFCKVKSESVMVFKLSREEVISFKDREHHVLLKKACRLHFATYFASFAPPLNCKNIVPTLQKIWNEARFAIRSYYYYSR